MISATQQMGFFQQASLKLRERIRSINSSKQIVRIVGPRSGFRVILNAERHPGRIPDSFQRVIIEVDMCNLGIRGKAVPHNMESMILGCDLNAAVHAGF